jgi:predicted DNA-binding protein
LLRMSEPMDETFKKLAAIHRRSKSDYIRIVLEDHLNALKSQHDKKSKAS